MNRMKILTSLAIALTIAIVPVYAQKKATKPSVGAVAMATLKSAEAVLKASDKAMGKAAADKIISSITTATMEVPASGIKGDMETIVSKDRFFMKQSLPGTGDFIMGFDGKKGWAKDPINGLRELEGAELTQLRDETKASSDWKTRFKKAELLGIRKVGTAKAYAIRLTPVSGAVQTQYIDIKTFFLLRADTVAVGPQGKTPIETYLSDYRLIDGTYIPFKTRSVVFGIQEVLVTFRAVKNNVPVDETIFFAPKATPKK